MRRQRRDRSSEQQPENRATRLDAETNLTERYRQIGITSVAAAVKFQGERHNPGHHNARQTDRDIEASKGRRSKT